MMEADADFWQALEQLVASSQLVIDRPRGSCHPRYPTLVYPLDYGYLDGTLAMDGSGIDVWRGTAPEATVDGVFVTVDLVKKDSEIKILLGCSSGEIEAVYAFHNNSSLMKAALIAHRPPLKAGSD